MSDTVVPGEAVKFRRNAVALVRTMREQQVLGHGGGALVGPNLVLTAFHIVGNAKNHKLFSNAKIDIELGDFHTMATVVELLWDPVADWALLQMRESTNEPPFALTELGPDDDDSTGWKALTFTIASPFDGHIIKGVVRHHDGRQDGVLAYELHADELRGHNVRGTSGTPLIVADNTIAGIFRRAPDADASRGILFACPVSTFVSAVHKRVSILPPDDPLVLALRTLSLATTRPSTAAPERDPQPPGSVLASPASTRAAETLQVLPIEGMVWMNENLNVEDGFCFGRLVVRLLAPVGPVQLTSIDLSCVNEQGLWAWGQDQQAFIEGGQGRNAVGLFSYINLTHAHEVGCSGFLLSIERTFKPRLPMQFPGEWTTRGTCFVLEVKWIDEYGKKTEQRYCFKCRAARSIEAIEAPPSPPCLGQNELMRMQEQGFLHLRERELLESVDNEERYLLMLYPSHYKGRYRATSWPTYDMLLAILSDLRERLENHPLPPLAPPERSHRAEFLVPSRHKEITLPMSPSRPETLRVTSRAMELLFAVEGLVVHLVDESSFERTIVVTWIE